jgi:hypothetical protein
MKQKWWGYKHINGSIHAKPFWEQADLDDAYESPFCIQVVEPFMANSRDEALKIVSEKTK